MGFRDRLRARASKGLKNLLKRAIDFASEDQAPPKPPQPKPPKPPKPPKKPPAKSSEDLPPGDLLQELADSTAHSNEIVRRLNAMGYEDQAKAVVSSTIGQATDTTQLNSLAFAAKHAADQSKRAVQAAFEALKDSGNVLSERAKDLMKRAEALMKSAEQAAEDAQHLADEVQAKADEIDRLANVIPEHRDISEYDWDRKDVNLPYEDPEEMWKTVKKKWEELSIGVTSEQKERGGRSRFAPRMIARGSSVDPGVKVPRWALVNQHSFKTWCSETGLAKGLSLTMTGIYTGPGMASMLRT